MAAPVEKPKTGTGTNISVMIIIWVTLAVLIFANPVVKNFFSSIFSKPNQVFQDVIILASSKNIFSDSKIYYNKKPSVYDIAQSPANSDHFWAATNYGLFLSSDKGANWHHFNLPDSVGDETPIYRIFTNPQTYEVSILILRGNNGIIYSTYNNFYSVIKSFEISKEVADKILKNRNISTITANGNGFIIGTVK